MDRMISLKLRKRIEITDLPDLEIIRYDESAHSALIPALYGEGFGDDPWDDAWDDFPEFDRNGVFIAYLDDQPAGFVVCFQKGSAGYISVLTVLPDYRGNRYSIPLVYRALDYLQSRGLKDIYIKVEPENVPAYRLYQKIGFSETEQHMSEG